MPTTSASLLEEGKNLYILICSLRIVNFISLQIQLRKTSSLQVLICKKCQLLSSELHDCRKRRAVGLEFICSCTELFIHVLRCYSMVGRIGGQQKISIGRGCEYLHTVIHEIGEYLKLTEY